MPFLSRLLQSRRGNAVQAFAGLLPLVLASIGAAVDYGNLVLVQSRLQGVADGAALTAAKELRLAGAQDQAVRSVAENYARAALPTVDNLVVEASIATSHDQMSVTLRQRVEGYLPKGFSPFSTEVAATAEAKVVGGSPTCLLGLDEAADATIQVDSARVTAPRCAVYSNSSSPDGLRVESNAAIKAAMICSGGGIRNTSGTLQPAGKTDCPRSADPLGDRPAPKVGSCTHTNKVAIGIAVLSPGVYCGGLKIAKLTAATLLPGDYVIKDGPLIIEDGAAVTGVGAGFYLTGSGAVFNIAPTTLVNLVAPIVGPLAGMLFFEDRSNAPGVHRINSRNAPVLLGTFYLSRSRLEVGAPGGAGLLTNVVGALSAWTIVVAREVSINDGLNLTLNTDYSATKVPVPEGVGGGTVGLVR